MGTSAAILGVADKTLSAEERAFMADMDPWGFILFGRNIENPSQVIALINDLRAAVGRHAPVLIDQEGGRVQRLRAPHWREWAPVGDLLTARAMANDESALLEALELRYRLIAGELDAMGIDVNCMPLLDLRTPEGHGIIGDRALGDDPVSVARRARAVIDGLKAGGVLPVVKHLPGHGRAPTDSHLALPRISTPRAELQQTDFAAFRPFAGEALGMTAHVVFDAIDPENCATHSLEVIAMIRDEIGFDGLLMTDDLSMKALSGPVGRRVTRALDAGCDMILHCNGDLSEMREIAAHLPVLSGAAQRRADAAETARPSAAPFDAGAALERYRTLAGEEIHA